MKPDTHTQTTQTRTHTHARTDARMDGRMHARTYTHPRSQTNIEIGLILQTQSVSFATGEARQMRY